jgi:hypothetical protein
VPIQVPGVVGGGLETPPSLAAVVTDKQGGNASMKAEDVQMGGRKKRGMEEEARSGNIVPHGTGKGIHGSLLKKWFNVGFKVSALNPQQVSAVSGSW